VNKRLEVLCRPDKSDEDILDDEVYKKFEDRGYDEYFCEWEDLQDELEKEKLKLKLDREETQT